MHDVRYLSLLRNTVLRAVHHVEHSSGHKNPDLWTEFQYHFPSVLRRKNTGYPDRELQRHQPKADSSEILHPGEQIHLSKRLFHLLPGRILLR